MPQTIDFYFKIDFYFDIVSPYTYMATAEISELASRCDAQVCWKPIFLGGLFKSLNNPNVFGSVPQKVPYLKKDMQRLARYLGVPFQFPENFPVNTLLAQRALAQLPEDQVELAARKLFDALWAQGAEIASPEVVAAATGEEAVVRAGTPEGKQALVELTQSAMERGAFGAPTFFVGEEMFFGHDRLTLLEAHLLGKL
jgi:2-hydroxychromene-2-carboxylate isomerase